MQYSQAQLVRRGSFSNPLEQTAAHVRKLVDSQFCYNCASLLRHLRELGVTVQQLIVQSDHSLRTSEFDMKILRKVVYDVILQGNSVWRSKNLR